MSKDQVIHIPLRPTSPGSGNNLDLNDVEMVFGTPTSPKSGQHDTHRIDNENSRLPAATSKNEADAQKEPLLEPQLPRPKPPLAGPEIDDLDEEKPADNTPYPGIDDGLLEPGDHSTNTPELFDDDDAAGPKANGDPQHKLPDNHEDGVGTSDGGVDSRFGDDRPGSPMPIPGSIPDVNTYQQKKNLAQGMMDLALLSANANQLRYVLESSVTHPYYYPSLVLISFSILFQVFVGIGLIMNSRYNVKDDKDICKADKINNMTVLGIFMITLVNVFITSFSVATPMASTTAIATGTG